MKPDASSLAPSRSPRATSLEKLFAFNLASTRQKAKLSRTQLAGKSGIAEHTIDNIENMRNGRRASIGEAVVLAEALGVLPGDLLKRLETRVERA